MLTVNRFTILHLFNGTKNTAAVATPTVPSRQVESDALSPKSTATSVQQVTTGKSWENMGKTWEVINVLLFFWGFAVEAAIRHV